MRLCLAAGKRQLARREVFALVTSSGPGGVAGAAGRARSSGRRIRHVVPEPLPSWHGPRRRWTIEGAPRRVTLTFGGYQMPTGSSAMIRGSAEEQFGELHAAALAETAAADGSRTSEWPLHRQESNHSRVSARTSSPPLRHSLTGGQLLL
jgi:hypothetical protein